MARYRITLNNSAGPIDERVANVPANHDGPCPIKAAAIEILEAVDHLDEGDTIRVERV